MIQAWRCLRSIRPAVVKRCFTTTAPRLELRSLTELPDRIGAGLHGTFVSSMSALERLLTFSRNE